MSMINMVISGIFLLRIYLKRGNIMLWWGLNGAKKYILK